MLMKRRADGRLRSGATDAELCNLSRAVMEDSVEFGEDDVSRNRSVSPASSRSDGQSATVANEMRNESDWSPSTGSSSSLVSSGVSVAEGATSGPSSSSETVSSVTSGQAGRGGHRRSRRSGGESAAAETQGKRTPFPPVRIQLVRLEIGDWTCFCAVFKLYFGRKQLVEEIQIGRSEALRKKIVVRFELTSEILFETLPSGSELLSLTLREAPQFYSEIQTPADRKSEWELVSDFTPDFVASKSLTHRLEFPRGTLTRRYGGRTHRDKLAEVFGGYPGVRVSYLGDDRKHSSPDSRASSSSKRNRSSKAEDVDGSLSTGLTSQGDVVRPCDAASLDSPERVGGGHGAVSAFDNFALNPRIDEMPPVFRVFLPSNEHGYVGLAAAGSPVLGNDSSFDKVPRGLEDPAGASKPFPLVDCLVTDVCSDCVSPFVLRAVDRGGGDP